MGGLVCQFVVRSKLTYTAVPTDPDQLKEFDAQMREIHFNTEYSQSVINETSYATDIIKTLSTPDSEWTLEQRETMLDAVAAVCGHYS